MRHVRFGLILGVISAIVGIGACALDESGTYSDSGVLPDVTPQNDASLDLNVAEDATYDVPDLGTGETEAGVPCTCVSAVPSGYTVVEYVPNQRPNCDTPLYGGHTDWVESPTAGASTCTCTCGTPNPSPMCSCGQPGTFNISSGNGNCTDVTNETVMASGPACYKTGQSLTPGGNRLNNMLAAPSAQNQCAPQGGGCQNPSKTTTFPPYTSEMGRSCPLTAATGTCSTSGVCIPTPSPAYALCVTNSTNDSCPTDFPVAHFVGANVVDNRACGPNACTSCGITDGGTCGTPQLTLYSGDNNCGNSGSNVTLPVDNATCVSAGYGNGTTFDSAKYTVSQSGGACGLSSAFAPTGGVVVTGGYTICCHP